MKELLLKLRSNYDLVKLVLSFVSQVKTNDKNELLCILCCNKVVIKNFDKLIMGIINFEAFHNWEYCDHYKYIDKLVCKICTNHIYSDQGKTYVDQLKSNNHYELITSIFDHILTIRENNANQYNKFVMFLISFITLVPLLASFLSMLTRKTQSDRIKNIYLWLHIAYILFSIKIMILFIIFINRGNDIYHPNIKQKKRKYKIICIVYTSFFVLLEMARYLFDNHYCEIFLYVLTGVIIFCGFALLQSMFFI